MPDENPKESQFPQSINQKMINSPGGIQAGGNVTIHQAAPVTYTALHQLPPPSADFVGREKEMAELLQALEQGGVTISGLQGMGGIGKTALALKLAEQLKPKYPDAQFYLDMRGASKEPLTSAHAMAHVIHSYHPEAQLPDDENSLRGLYHSLLNDKKTLLLMDNAASAEQVKPLIPPTGSTMLVTSRNHFTLSSFFVKDLDTLEPTDAEQLLLKIAPRIGKSAGKIAALCGYLPLALEVAASALKKSVNLIPEVYALRLSKATKRLELIEASLKLSYDLLSVKMQRHWRSLAVFPNTFDDNAVAALWQSKIEDTQDRLADLISYSLIEWNETTRRYRLHDLVRVFADSRLSGQERFSAKKAHAVYFMFVLAKAGLLYLKGNEEMMSGLAQFDLERESIDAGRWWAFSLLGEEKAATELSKHYHTAGANILELRIPPRERIKYFDIALKAFRLSGDKEGEGGVLANLGNAYMILSEARKAIESYEQSLTIARERGNRSGEGYALGGLGNVYANLGDVRKAIEFQEQHLAITRETGDRRDEGNALLCLGVAYSTLDDANKAKMFYEQFLAISREIGDRLGEGTALSNLGSASLSLGETGKAIEFLEQALVITREIGDRRGESADLSNLGVAYQNLGEVHKAIKSYEQGVVIAREIDDRMVESSGLLNLAIIYNKLEDRAQAISFAEMALSIYEQIESPEASKVRSYLEKWKSEQA